MKYGKITIGILAIIILLNINSTSFAKYVYSYTQTAVILEIQTSK